MPSPSDSAVATVFTRAEWDLRVRLSGQVMIAAMSAEGFPDRAAEQAFLADLAAAFGG